MSDKNKGKVINPATGETVEEYDYLSEDAIPKKIEESYNAYLKYRETDYKSRAEKLNKLADVLEKNIDKIAKTITTEMGKAIKESKAEVQKSAKHCRYYAEHLEEFLKPEVLKTDHKKAQVYFQPMGSIYHITPFNFPLWLIMKGVIPCIAAGNTVINKNPTICPRTGQLAEEAFREAGFNNGEFLNIQISQKHSENLIKDKRTRGVSFTGSTGGGSKIAELAGKYCKKSVMELGGSDPCIVLKDADIDLSVTEGIKSRLLDCGQVCIAAKRFLVDESIYDQFKAKLVEQVKGYKVGDPMEEDTQVGPLAKKDGLDGIIEQVEKSVKDGGKVLCGGSKPTDEKLKNGYFYMPTVLEVEEGNSINDEETFGPIFALMKVKDEEEAIRIANSSKYGLGGMVFGKDEDHAEQVALKVESGVVYVNQMLASSSDCPSGGIKDSGYGRECAHYGIREFCNEKTIAIAKTK